jgi:hypothetical protein
MAVVLKYYDYVPGQRRPPASERLLRLVSERVGIREIIRRRVQQEVEQHNAAMSETFYGLVQPTDSERALNGYELRNERRLDPDEQVRVALDAFERRGFLVLFDERQVERLDDEVVLTGDNTVAFLRLMPLVGG